MAKGVLSWNSAGKNWSYEDLPTNFRTDWNTNRAVKKEVELGEIYVIEQEPPSAKNRFQGKIIIGRDITRYMVYPDGTRKAFKKKTYRGEGQVKGSGRGNKEYEFADKDVAKDIEDKYDNLEDKFKKWTKSSGKANEKANEKSKELNQNNKERNKRNGNINKESREVIKLAENTSPGTYIQQRNVINSIGRGDGISKQLKQNFRNEFRKFYLDEKVSNWDPKIGAQPPAGDFDSAYYLNKNKDVKDAWDRAVANDNLDIIGPVGFSETAWASQHYTEYGQYERRRANKKEETTAANSYVLKAPTDVEKAAIRDRQLGITATQEVPLEERLRDDERVVKLWEEVREGGNDYYDQKKEELGLDLNNFSDFAAAFLAGKESDTQTASLTDQLLADEVLVEGEEYITDIEDALTRAAGDAAREKVEDFGVLTQSVLKDTLQKLEQAKKREQEFDMFSGFAGFGEVMNPGAGLANSILGDSGIGGYMGFLGGPEKGEQLQEGINAAFGMGNLTEVNWQNWFDQELTEKYAKDFEDKFEALELKRNILEAAGPNNQDFIAYVNSNQKLADKYINYVKQTPEEERLTKAEWGAENFAKTGGKGEDISALKKTVWDADKNTFTDEFLANSFFDDSDDVTDFLESLEEEGETILDTITSDDFDSLSLVDQIEAVNRDIESIDDGTFDLNLSTELGEQAIEAQFARDFINDYVRPRFNQSKSMSEFRDYLSVDPRYQTPFQTQNIIDALKTTAQERANAYLEQVNGAVDQNFDSDFYFDPTEGFGEAVDKKTNLQKSTVEQDYKNALEGKSSGNINWAQEMYRYGVPITYENDVVYGGDAGYYTPIKSIDKDAFARMHYELKGKFGIQDPDNPENTIRFIPAKNVADPDRIKRYVYYEVMPMLEDEAVDVGSIFGEFVTPEEFADDILGSLDMEDDEALAEILKDLGIEDVSEGIDEIREQLVEMVASNDAIAIRKGIKAINEQGLDPDQQNLGVTYIDREEDYEGAIKAESQLFKAFQNAGFKGTESEFYDQFLPDTDKEELQFLEDSMSGLSFDAGSFSDPFSAMVTVQGYFPDDDGEGSAFSFGDDKDKFSTQYSDAYKSDSMFNLGGDVDSYGYDKSYTSYGPKKSKAGLSFLQGFTKGFTSNKKSSF